jgi:hypothetical protein
MKRQSKRIATSVASDEQKYRPPNSTVDSASTSTAVTASLSYASDTVPCSPTEAKSSTMIKPRMSRISKPFVFAIDFFVVLFLLQVAMLCFLLDGQEGTSYNKSLIQAAAAFKFHGQSHLEFQQTFNEDDMEPCHPILTSHDVSFSLALSLVEKDLEKVPHHCKRWGIQAPISIAVWTELSPEQVRDKIVSFPSSMCHPNQLTITTLSPTMDGRNYRNQLRNLAIKGASTTHVLPLDIHMWTSIDLYETLHSPYVVRALANDPKLAVLVPAFEVNLEFCNKHGVKGCSGNVPGDYDDLIVHLAEKAVAPMDPMDYELQGNTDYRAWVRQPRSSLLNIDCISSANRFQPFLIVQRCQSLPPFQEDTSMPEQAQTGNVHATDSTWTIHLIQLGYSIQQLGGEFLVYLQDSWTGRQDVFDAMVQRELEGSHPVGRTSRLGYLRNDESRRPSKTRDEFFRWLDQTTPGRPVVSTCEEAVDVAP